MSAFAASSPMPTRASSSKSPLRAFAPFEGVGAEVYADAHARLVQWRKDLGSSASFDAQQDLRELCHEKEHLKDLKSDLAGVQSLVGAAAQLQVGGTRLAEVVRSSTEAAATRAQSVARVRDELDRVRDSHRQELQQEERTVSRQKEMADAQHADSLKLLGVYKERLGLEITRVAPQIVRMAFSLMDNSDPSRVFFFTLGLADCEDKASDGYCVRECTPPVPELQKLVEELNADTSSTVALPRFVCLIRRCFIKMAGGKEVA